MPKIVLDKDISAGIKSPITATSTVTVNGKKMALDQDVYGQGSSVIATGKITINGKKIVLDGDKLTDGDASTSTSTVTVT